MDIVRQTYEEGRVEGGGEPEGGGGGRGIGWERLRISFQSFRINVFIPYLVFRPWESATRHILKEKNLKKSIKRRKEEIGTVV